MKKFEAIWSTHCNRNVVCIQIFIHNQHRVTMETINKTWDEEKQGTS